jgi:hypothetical protein
VLDHMERICDLNRLRKGVVDHFEIQDRNVQRPQRIVSRHALGCASIHSDTVAAVRPSMTSFIFGSRSSPPTLTPEVAHSLDVRGLRRTNGVSSNPEPHRSWGSLMRVAWCRGR